MFTIRTGIGEWIRNEIKNEMRSHLTGNKHPDRQIKYGDNVYLDIIAIKIHVFAFLQSRMIAYLLML